MNNESNGHMDLPNFPKESYVTYINNNDNFNHNILL